MNTNSLLLSLCLLFTSSLAAQEAKTFDLNLSGGNFAGTPIPDYTRWVYFSFDKGDTVGSSLAVLDSISPAQVGIEVINEEWQARSDWDIAFHAGNIRTNSGPSGNGHAGSIVIQLAEPALFPSGETLKEAFDSLTAAPLTVYAPDTFLSGSFIFAMTAMPPLRATQISAAAAVDGWANVAMTGNQLTPTLAVFQTADGLHYVKVLLRQFFNDDSIPGHIAFDYAFIPLADPSGLPNVAAQEPAIAFDPLTGDCLITLPNIAKGASLSLYSLNGQTLAQFPARFPQTRIPAHLLPKSPTLLRITSPTFSLSRLLP